VGGDGYQEGEGEPRPPTAFTGVDISEGSLGLSAPVPEAGETGPDLTPSRAVLEGALDQSTPRVLTEPPTGDDSDVQEIPPGAFQRRPGHAESPAREDSLEITSNIGDDFPVGDVAAELDELYSQLDSRSQGNRLAIQPAGAIDSNSEDPLQYLNEISPTLRPSGVPATVHDSRIVGGGSPAVTNTAEGRSSGQSSSRTEVVTPIVPRRSATQRTSGQSSSRTQAITIAEELSSRRSSLPSQRIASVGAVATTPQADIPTDSDDEQQAMLVEDV
jgi:hypothetical protein